MSRVSVRRNVLCLWMGQSNEQGAAMVEGGVVPARAVSRYTGLRDPFPGCNNRNQGGSCLPYLVDLGLERGVFFHFLNYAIGGASAGHFTGRVGASISGGADATIPAAQGYMAPYGLSGGTTAAVEGGSGFDPFGLLARGRAAVAAARAVRTYDAVISFWSNAESDTGESSASYQALLESIANYLLASGSKAHFIGLSSKSAGATNGQMITLQAGVAAAIASLRAAGKPVYAGADLFARFGDRAPLVPEVDATTYVHGTLRYQEIRAQMLNAILQAAGF